MTFFCVRALGLLYGFGGMRTMTRNSAACFIVILYQSGFVDVEVLRNTPYFLEPGELHSKERSHLYVGTRGHASEQILILYSEREMPSKLLNGDVLQVPAIPGSKVLVLHNGGATCHARSEFTFVGRCSATQRSSARSRVCI